MRIILTCLFAFFWVSSTSAQKNSSALKNYNVKIQVHGLKDSTVYLANYYGDKQYIQDTAKADGQGKFSFSGKELPGGGIYLVVLPGKKYFEFIFVEPSFSLETDTADYVKNMKVKGSEENKLFFEYLKFISQKQKETQPLRAAYERLKDNKEKKDSIAIIRERLTAIDKEVKDYKLNFMKNHSSRFLAKIFKASQEPEIPEAPKLPNGKIDSTFAFRYYKAHFLDSVDFSDDRLLRTPVLHGKIEQYIKKLTVQVPDSINAAADYLVSKARANKEVFKYVVHYITNTYETSGIMGMDAVFVHMAEKYYTYDQAYWVDSTNIYKIGARAKTLKPLLIGKKAPALVLKDDKDVYRSLYDVKAKYTILLFWDPDCGHCKKVMPKVQELYHKVKSKGVEVYAVCTEVEKEKWLKYIEENKLDWINVADTELQNHFRAVYDITSTPQLYLLDQNKIIKAKKLDIEQLGDYLEKLLSGEVK